LGITGTPVIDEATQAIYLAAMVDDVAGPHHRVFALSLKDGMLLPGWPVDIATALAAQGQRFDTRVHNQRGALANLDGRVYVPYGGHYGDCGDYRAGSSAFACAIRAMSSAGARGGGEGGSGHRAGSPATAARC